MRLTNLENSKIQRASVPRHQPAQMNSKGLGKMHVTGVKAVATTAPTKLGTGRSMAPTPNTVAMVAIAAMVVTWYAQPWASGGPGSKKGWYTNTYMAGATAATQDA